MGSTPIYSIPFADPTDIVRDWPGLSEDVAEAVEAAISGVPVLAGMGSNVVQTVKTDTFSTTSATFENITGLAVTITPTSSSSKLLVIANINISVSNTNMGCSVRLDGGGTENFVGDAEGSRTRAFAFQSRTDASFESHRMTFVASVVALTSPNTTDAVTINAQMLRSAAGTAFVNRSGEDIDAARWARTVSTITAIEVAA